MPLRIIVVGAGIGGLTAALALGKQGHEVNVYEKSQFSNETGAAFHIGPHANRVLQGLDVDMSRMRPAICAHWYECSADLENIYDLAAKQRELGVSEDEIMLHRVDARTVLREHALALKNVHLHLSAAVETVDPAAAKISFQDGQCAIGDLVVGADGVHSKTIEAIAGRSCPTEPVGINMYRFMVPTAKARSDPAISDLLDKVQFENSHITILVDGGKRRLVLYPCRDASLMNMATFQPASQEKVKLTSDWTNPGHVTDVVELLTGWPEVYRQLVSMAEDVKHWAVVGRAVPETFVRDHLVVIGDAAHPTQPTHGAGAGMAIEDAGVLGAVFDSSADKSNLRQRLEVFNQLQYGRTVTVEYASELPILRRYVPDASIPKDVEAFL